MQIENPQDIFTELAANRQRGLPYHIRMKDSPRLIRGIPFFTEDFDPDDPKVEIKLEQPIEGIEILRCHAAEISGLERL